MSALPPVEPDPACSKAMTFGPCGGVHADETCEVDRRPCPFLSRPVRVDGRADPRATRPSDTPLGVRFVIDFRPGHDWSSRLDADLADRYRRGGPQTAWLVGEHVDDTHGLGIVEHVRRLDERFGLPIVVTITGRNRTRSQAEGVLDELADVGVAAVHCVTGDHPAARLGSTHHATFGVDSQMLVALATSRGLTVSVAESPASPPTLGRHLRVANKARAGADVVVVNHAGSADELRRFAHRCESTEVSIPLIGPVPLIADLASARRLTQFPGLTLDRSLLGAVLDSSDPVGEGRRQAIAFGRALLAPPTGDQHPFAGLNLSGLGPEDPRARADFVIDIIDQLG